jgi:hypothetical protein
MHALAIALLGAAFSSVSADSMSRCIIASADPSYLQTDVETYAVVRTLPGVIADSAGFRPGFTGDTISSRPTDGHLVRVESAIGLGSDSEAAPGEVIAIFNWAYSEGCHFFTHTRGLPADSMAHVTMTLRPQSAWVDGE